MAEDRVNKRGVAKARKLIDARQYRVRSRLGDFRRQHRMGLIACYYRAAEWEHTEVMLAAHNLPVYLDKSSR